MKTRKIAHISDLHIGSSLFVKEWGEKLIEILNSKDIDVLVVTGDITDDGMVEQYKKAKKYLDRIKIKNKILVPGNHDSRHAGYEVFEEFFGTRYPFYGDKDIAVFGVDSSQPDLNHGHIGREYYQDIKEKLSNPDKINILGLHHHLIPVPRAGRERQIPLDAGDALEFCTRSNVGFVLSGHRHQRWIWKLQDTYFIAGGTATTKKLNGFSHPSFNIIDAKKNHVLIKEFNTKDKSSKKLLRVKRKR